LTPLTFAGSLNGTAIARVCADRLNAPMIGGFFDWTLLRHPRPLPIALHISPILCHVALTAETTPAPPRPMPERRRSFVPSSPPIPAVAGCEVAPCFGWPRHATVSSASTTSTTSMGTRRRFHSKTMANQSGNAFPRPIVRHRIPTIDG